MMKNLIKRNIDLEKILVHEYKLVDEITFGRRKHKYEYVINLITEKQFLDSTYNANPYSFVRLQASQLQKVLGPRMAREIVNHLIAAKIVERDYFIEFKKCFGYRLTKKYCLSMPHLEEITNQQLSERFLRHESKRLRRCRYQEEQLKKLELDPESINSTLNLLIEDNNLTNLKLNDCIYNLSNSVSSTINSTNTSYHITFSDQELTRYNYLIEQCSQIETVKVPDEFGYKIVRKNNDKYDPGKFYFDLLSYLKFNSNEQKIAFRDETTSRLHSPITTMSKRIRHHLRLKDSDEKLVLIDVKNCQIHLLNLLLDGQITDEDELARFKEITSNGEFYELISKELSETRAWVKQHFFEYFFYCKDRGSRIKGAMYKHFPEITQFIVDYKMDDHSRMAINLQKEEASLFIDDIMSTVKKERKLNVLFLTIHDGILTKESDVEYLEQKIRDAYKNKGLEVSLDISFLS